MLQQLLPKTIVPQEFLNAVKSQLSDDNLPRTLELVLPRTTQMNYYLNQLLDIPPQTQNKTVLLH